MKLEVFEILHGFNEGMEKAIGQLESLQTMGEFSGDAVNTFLHDAERVQAGVNRWMAEYIHRESDREAAALDKVREAESQSE
jgi:hypothetical protein